MPKRSPPTCARARRGSARSQTRRRIRGTMALKGRHWFLIWLVAACAALWLVIWRQTDSFRTARTLNAVREQHAVLAGQRASLEARIRAAQSREQLIPRAAKLG